MQEFSMTLLTNCCNGLKTADVFSPSFQNIYFDFFFFLNHVVFLLKFL